MTYYYTYGTSHIHMTLPNSTLPKESKMTTATNELVYTDKWDGYSHAVETAIYDADTKTFAVELASGSVYAYKNVPEHVWNSFKASISKGRFYNKTIKKDYGPGTELDEWAVEEADKRAYNAPDMGSVTATAGSLGLTGTPKNLTYAADAKVDGKPVAEQRYSLVTNLQPALLEDRLDHTVRFTVGDNTEVKSYRFNAESVADAVAVVNGLGDAMGLEFKVTEVVTHFE